MRTSHHPPTLFFFRPAPRRHEGSKTKRPPRARARGFTLVELMVVVGIIALLIAIVLPSVNAARIQAKVATTKAEIRTLENAIEMFRNDHTVGGEYPPSAPSPNPSVSSGVTWPACVNPHMSPSLSINQRLIPEVQGANMLAWGLIGADLLGTPGFRDLDGDGVWESDTGSDRLYAIDGNDRPVEPRSGPFVDIDTLTFPQRSGDKFVIEGLSTKPELDTICFLDAFDQPILYYRANPGQPIPFGYCALDSPGTYNIKDNWTFTGDNGINNFGMDLGAGTNHPMGTRSGAPTAGRGLSFRDQLQNPQITAAVRPYRSDSFILISPGPDALWGTADDVANFDVPK